MINQKEDILHKFSIEIFLIEWLLNGAFKIYCTNIGAALQEVVSLFYEEEALSKKCPEAPQKKSGR